MARNGATERSRRSGHDGAATWGGRLRGWAVGDGVMRYGWLPRAGGVDRGLFPPAKSGWRSFEAALDRTRVAVCFEVYVKK